MAHDVGLTLGLVHDLDVLAPPELLGGLVDRKYVALGDAVGAIIGAVALVVFALIAYVLFTRVPGGAVEALALAAWLGVSILLYLLVRRLFR